MSGGNSIINLGDLTKPAEALINRVSEAIGGIAKPWQIERVARAESKAEIIRANARVEISEIEERGLLRLVREEGKKQENIESITMKSIEYLKDDAEPETLDDDWLSHFFERSRFFSEEDTQRIWAKLLAEEANNPGKISRRTIDKLSSLDKTDALLFEKLCSFIWHINDEPLLIIPNMKSELFNSLGIDFSGLISLEESGFITREFVGGFNRSGFGPVFVLRYFEKVIPLYFRDSKKSPTKNAIQTGPALLTKAGKELSAIVKGVENPTYMAGLIAEWEKAGISVVSIDEFLAIQRGEIPSRFVIQKTE
ncbi:hypothetical protein A33O_14335 [Nitratireductor aquibiodomus RA22]|uniref:DUF2806 domain-containing protein n=1 Tax=Nitratireductor aquibiodomus RA22 TaxID=1189611 RepID=I5BW13_9HYPH|nr:DUF2806 domain-containing protein [Nitratireductor aquibiodomus]EIM73765.1 hypothetical protein A33O_14335 [Nitratireductor aquibiodomus RA22]